MNRFLNDYLRNFCAENQSDWLKRLKVAEFAYNNSTHMSTGYSPFFLNYGQHPNVPVQHSEGSASASPESAEEFASQLSRVLRHAQACIGEAQQRQKLYADRKRMTLVIKYCCVLKITT